MQPVQKDLDKQLQQTEREIYGMIIRKKALRNKIALVLFVIIAGLLINNAITKNNENTIVNETEHLKEVE